MTLPDREEVLVTGAWVITMAGRRPRRPFGAVATTHGLVADGAVHLRAGEIVAVGPAAELTAAHPGLPVVGDGTGVVLPGLVNTHTHLSEALATGMGSELSLFEWGERIIAPLGNALDAERAREGTALRAVELLLSGVTCVNDMFVHTARGSLASLGVVDGLERAGLRGVVSYGAEDIGGLDATGAARRVLEVAEVVAEQQALADRCRSADLVGFRWGIGTLLGQSDELLAEAVAQCLANGWGVHTHLAEVREELVQAGSRWGERTIAHARRIGLLDVPVLAGHAIWLGEEEIDTLARYRVGIAHNPVANMILGSGVCPVPALRGRGVAVGIGTDGAASNDSQDMLQAVKAAALLHKLDKRDPWVIDAWDVLEMATTGGARALGLDHLVGSLEPGKRADVVLLQDTVDVAVLHDPISQVVYGASPRSVREVWVDGRRVVSDHRCVTVDEAEQVARCRPLVAGLARDSGLAASGHSLCGVRR
ncbi:MAG: amidohydrolase family protein [Propionicimonas sp.]|nr:amidohydrolase family protein [Propionicimonas sp.]